MTEQEERTLDALVKLRDAIAKASRSDRRRWVAVFAKMAGGGRAGIAFYSALGTLVEAVDIATKDAATDV